MLAMDHRYATSAQQRGDAAQLSPEGSGLAGEEGAKI
jgi:hypothetical protein